MLKNIIILLLFVSFCQLHAQQTMLNNSIILEEFAILPHIVPKGTIQAKVIVNVNNSIDTIGVEFDSLHRVIKVNNNYYNCKITYKKNNITKVHTMYFPNYFFPTCSSFITNYLLNDSDYIISSVSNCQLYEDSIKYNSIKMNYSYLANDNNNIVRSTLVEPTYALEYNYHLITYNDRINMMKFDYATNKYRLVYSIDNRKGRYNFNFKNRHTRERGNYIYYSYTKNEKFDGILQTPIHNTEGKVIGELSVLR